MAAAPDATERDLCSNQGASSVGPLAHGLVESPSKWVRPLYEKALLHLSRINDLDGQRPEGIDQRLLGYVGDFNGGQEVGGVFSQKRA